MQHFAYYGLMYLLTDKERKNVKSQGLLYLRNLIVAAKKIKKINNPKIKNYCDEIEKL